MISNRCRSCFLDVRDKRRAEIDLERDHHLMVSYLRLRVTYTASRKVGVLQPSKFEIACPADKTTDGSNNLLENINAIKNVLFLGATPR